jgi:predicted kinase
MESTPKDIKFVPKACVIGLPSSGKHDICQRISQTTGAVHLRINEIIETFIGMDSVLG